MLGIDPKAARYAWTAALVVLALLTIYVIRETLDRFRDRAPSRLPALSADGPDRSPPDSRKPRARARHHLHTHHRIHRPFRTLHRLGSHHRGDQPRQRGARVSRSSQPEPSARAARRHVAHWPREGRARRTDSPALRRYRLLHTPPDAAHSFRVEEPHLHHHHPDPELLHIEGRPCDSRQLFSIFSAAVAKRPKETLDSVHTLLLQYMRALLFLCCATFVSFSIVLSAMQVPYAILLAAIAFPLEFVPLVGPLTAAGIIIVVSIVTGYAHVWWGGCLPRCLLACFRITFSLAAPHEPGRRTASAADHFRRVRQRERSAGTAGIFLGDAGAGSDSSALSPSSFRAQLSTRRGCVRTYR